MKPAVRDSVSDDDFVRDYQRDPEGFIAALASAPHKEHAIFTSTPLKV